MTEEVKEENFINSLENLRYDLKRNFIYSKSALSLQELALMKVAEILWRVEADSRFMRCLLIQPSHEETLAKVINKVSLLSLSIYCQKALEKMIRSFEREINSFLFNQRRHDGPISGKFWKFGPYFCWTQQGKINTMGTIERVIDHACLSDKEKFILACECCLTKKIQELYQKLPSTIIDEFAKIDEYRLEYIWIIHCQEKYKNLNFSLVKRHSIGDFLNWSISLRKEAAVQYILENMEYDSPSDDYKNHLEFYTSVELQSRFSSYGNILLYLLTLMNASQLKEVCTIGSVAILEILHGYAKWHDLVGPATTYMLENNINSDFRNTLIVLIMSWHFNRINVEKYRQIWMETTRFELLSEEEFKNFFYRWVSVSFEKGDIITFELLLASSTVEHKQLLYDYQGVNLCLNLIYQGKLNHFSTLITDMLPLTEIANFKKGFWNQWYLTVTVPLIVECKYELLEVVVETFTGQEGKKELPYVEVKGVDMIGYIFQFFKLKDEERLMVVDKFLSWSFNGNEVEIATYKTVFFNLDKEHLYPNGIDAFRALKKCLSQIMVKLWLTCKVEVIAEYCRWLYKADYTVGTSEKKLERIMNILSLFPQEATEYIKLLIDTCLNPEELDGVKEVLENSDHLISVVRYLLEQGSFVEVENLLNWCFNSDKLKIYLFKMKFDFRSNYFIEWRKREARGIEGIKKWLHDG